MADGIKVSDTVEVPKNTGVSGFLEVIRGILRRPRILSISVDARGKVTYTRYVRDGEDKEPINIDFETFTPMSVIRSCPDIEEVDVLGLHAGTAVAKLFSCAATDQMVPLAFCVHPATGLWAWFKTKGGLALAQRDEFFGFPLAYDDQLPPTALFLCTAYERDASLVDTRKVYKLTFL